MAKDDKKVQSRTAPKRHLIYKVNEDGETITVFAATAKTGRALDALQDNVGAKVLELPKG